jgi:hypothetical protein
MEIPEICVRNKCIFFADGEEKHNHYDPSTPDKRCALGHKLDEHGCWCTGLPPHTSPEKEVSASEVLRTYMKITGDLFEEMSEALRSRSAPVSQDQELTPVDWNKEVANSNDYIDQVVEEFRERFSRGNYWSFEDGDAKPIEQFLREKLEEQARNERLRCETHIPVIKESIEHGKTTERQCIREIVEGMKRSCEICENGEEHDTEYNQALDDLLSRLSEGESTP